MDASDILRRNMSLTVRNNYALGLAKQPRCNFSTCTVSLTSTCVVNYVDYQQRNLVQVGQKYATCGSNL